MALTLDVHLPTSPASAPTPPPRAEGGRHLPHRRRRRRLGTARFAALDQPDGRAAGTLPPGPTTAAGLQTIDLKVVPTSGCRLRRLKGYNRNALAVATSIDRMLAADDAGTATTARSPRWATPCWPSTAPRSTRRSWP